MKEYFKHQDKQKPITKEVLSELKGKSLYGDYEEGDCIFVFMEMRNKPLDDTVDIELILHTIVERHFDLFKKDYIFVEMKKPFPVFKKRKESEI